MSIRSALETNYPEGIIYILSNTLAQLQTVGINYQPAKYSKSYDDGSSEMIGYPDQNRLRNAIKIAEEVRQQWDEITRLGGVAAQIQAMENIKNMIRTEDLWMYGMAMTVKGVKEIYQFYYTDEEYQRERGNNLPKQPISNAVPDPNPPFPTTYPQPQSRILTFEEFLQQNPGLLYLLEPEQREEYKKYLASMGVQPPSPTPPPGNSNYGTKNGGDDNVW